MELEREGERVTPAPALCSQERRAGGEVRERRGVGRRPLGAFAGNKVEFGFSTDQGKGWSDDIILRSDATDWDLGYTRSVQRPDGKVVTVYYYNDATSTERFIGGTLWAP